MHPKLIASIVPNPKAIKKFYVPKNFKYFMKAIKAIIMRVKVKDFKKKCENHDSCNAEL